MWCCHCGGVDGRNGSGRKTYLMVLPVRRRIHCGIGRFCFCFLARICLVRKVLWEGCKRKKHTRYSSSANPRSSLLPSVLSVSMDTPVRRFLSLHTQHMTALSPSIPTPLPPSSLLCPVSFVRSVTVSVYWRRYNCYRDAHCRDSSPFTRNSTTQLYTCWRMQIGTHPG